MQLTRTLEKRIMKKGRHFFLVGSYWKGSDQSQRFYSEGIWENGDEKFKPTVKSVAPGDLLVNKSTYAKNRFGYLRIKGVGVVTKNYDDGRKLDVKWAVKNKKIDIPGFSSYRRRIAEISAWDLGIILSVFDKKTLGDIARDDMEEKTYSSTESFSKEELDDPYLKYIEDASPNLEIHHYHPEVTEAKSIYEPDRQITLFYGTNRKRSNSKKPNDYYDDQLAEQIAYGSCKVSIPRNHRQGELERPKLWKFEFGESVKRHIVMTSVTETDHTSFHDWLKESLAENDEKSLLLFIHGYNTSFAEAAWRTAQITHDIPFPGIAGFYSWPSSTSVTGYLADIEKADSSITLLETFIEDMVIRTGAEKLHIIAHSMGNRIATRALNNLAAKTTFKDHLKTIHQIVLAAPDIDKDVYNTQIHPVFKTIGARRTLYASEKDRALKISKTLRRGRMRIGEGGAGVYVTDGLDTIDASNVMSHGNHHSYIFETSELLSDLNGLFIKDHSPVERKLKERNLNKMIYWLFKE